MSHPPDSKKTADLHITDFEPLDPPVKIKQELAPSDASLDSVAANREAIRNTIHGKDPRFVVVVGPCSIHDGNIAFEYAEKLKSLQSKIENEILLVMRVYFEKPRTTVGWKGLINDPHLDGTEDINRGLRLAREIFLKISSMGLACATEFLDPIVPQYTADLVSWAAIGARTTESQTHREMASGLSMPVGFKNSTDGGLQSAMNSIVSATASHSFLGIDQEGRTSIVRTQGNRDVHLVLRGGDKPNYAEPHIAFTKASLQASGAHRLIMVDCSHGNSNKDYRKQPSVFENIVNQYCRGEHAILGAMLESNIHEGKQSMTPGQPIQYGISITDGCISWETTEELLLKAAKEIRLAGGK